MRHRRPPRHRQGAKKGRHASPAADRIPERITRIVQVDAGPLPGGMARIDFNRPQTQEEWRRQAAEKGNGRQLPVAPFDPAADPDNLAGLTGEHLARRANLATPQPFRPPRALWTVPRCCRIRTAR
ncbi:hypothetical protein GCM10010211_61650 [Streptomyces albospinus]|uniref:Uncharacterized protein n=1 Tax=Streptomyces albospinus TaxID=285515 RepID=A0ABQ2VHC0_9ACTN|nr:hypothetical protein GCM10010211_61650 [Streptomyces albospinus]